MLWFQLLAIAPLAWLGTRFGRKLGQSPSPWKWGTAFSAALLWILLVILGHRLPFLSLTPPISWSTDITFAPPFMAFLIPAMFATLLPRLPRQRKAFITVVTTLMVINYALLPAACPLAVQSALAATTTKFDPSGICLQTHPYTCGPAATVTCLRTLGIAADEGPLAIAARCGPMVGTDTRFLAQTINTLYADRGIRADCRYIDSLDTFPTPAIAAMDMPMVGGHFVAILKITPTHILVGDPYSGRANLPRPDFERQFTGLAIPLHRTSAPLLQ